MSDEEVKDPAAVLAELRRVQEDLKAVRAELKTTQDERDGLKSQVESLGSDEMRTKALLAETKLALQKQGIKDVDRIIKYVGTEGLDFDDKGGVSGLEDRLKTLKTDLPEIFDPKVRAGGKADIFANDSGEVKEDPFRSAVHSALNK